MHLGSGTPGPSRARCFRKPDGSGWNARREIRAACARFEARLDGRQPLGKGFGLADIAALLLVLFASTLGGPPEPEGRRVRWLDREVARPSASGEIGTTRGAPAAA